MAIIDSIVMDGARGSLGNVTLRGVRSRTIASKKRKGVDTSTRAGLSLREFMFGLITRFAAERAVDINVSFEKTKYGTQRNMFMKVNYAHLSKAFEELYIIGGEVWEVSSQAMTDAVSAYVSSNPSTVIRSKIGSTVEYLEGTWEPNSPQELSVVVSAKLAGKSMADGVSIVTSDGNIPVGTTVEMVVSPDITTVTGGFLSALASGASNETNILLTDVVQNGNVVTGKTATAITKGTYTYLTFSVQSPVAVGELASKSYRNIVAAEHQDTGNNPL